MLTSSTEVAYYFGWKRNIAVVPPSDPYCYFNIRKQIHKYIHLYIHPPPPYTDIIWSGGDHHWFTHLHIDLLETPYPFGIISVETLSPVGTFQKCLKVPISYPNGIFRRPALCPHKLSGPHKDSKERTNVPIDHIISEHT